MHASPPFFFFAMKMAIFVNMLSTGFFFSHKTYSKSVKYNNTVTHLLHLRDEPCGHFEFYITK